jgi:quercetin dioxygenase-like cupin family protein
MSLFNKCLATVIVVILGTVANAQESVTMPSVPLGEEKWIVNPSVPATMMYMMIYGAPNKPGPFIFRAKFPPGYKLPPHKHPDVRTVTVLKGTYYSAIGETFDESKLQAFPAGTFYFTPSNTGHFSATKDEEVIIQESGEGPESGIKYMNPSDDPRKKD